MAKLDWRQTDPKARFRNTDACVDGYKKAESGPFVVRRVTKWEAKRQYSKLTPAKVYYVATMECGHYRTFAFEPIKTETLQCRRCKEK